MQRIKILKLTDAASMLQPHMSRDALTWLLADQLSPPQIPYKLVRGKRYYSATDIAAYIVRFLNPDAAFPPDLPRDTSMAQRKRADRRTRQLPLPPGTADRRDPSRPDRRQLTATKPKPN